MKTLVAERRADGVPCRFIFTGPDGIGCKSFVGQVFHEEPKTFGGLCIEVSGTQPDGAPTPLSELLGLALRVLGLPESDQPASDAARADAFQRISAGRRFMMMIKDPATLEQVECLVPESAPEAVVVVTTPVMMRSLMELEFVDVLLDGLPAEESQQLLKHSIGAGAERLAPETITELAKLCDGIPLLIKMLGHRVRRNPDSAGRYLQDLRESHSVFLKMDPSRRLQRFLETTYDTIGSQMQEAYRRLSLIPGPAFSAAAAVATLEADSSAVGYLLDELVETNLLQFDNRTGRYAFYRVIQADARRRASEVDGPRVVRAVTETIVTWYLREGIPRDKAVSDRWRVGPEFVRHDDSDAPPVSRPVALAWFSAEWESVVACVRAAHTQALHDVAWQLCVMVFKYLHLHGHNDAWLDCHQLGVASAQISGSLLGIMQVTSQRGAAYLALGNHTAARADFEASLQAAREAVDRRGEQSACEWLGKTAAAEHEYDLAESWFDASEAVIDQFGDKISAAQQLRMRALLALHRARTSRSRGQFDRAHAQAGVALDHFRSTEELENQAKCLTVMAATAAGPAQAVMFFEQAVKLFAADGARRGRAEALHGLGGAKEKNADLTGAVEALEGARDLYAALADAAADALQARINELTGR